MSQPIPQTSPAVGKAICLLILATLCAYSNSFTKQFVLDDGAWITSNPLIKNPIEYLKSPIGKTRPIVAASIVLNYELHQLQPPGYHFFNIAVHLLAGLALFGVVRRTLLLDCFPQSYRDRSTWLALAIALLWLVHPLQTQSVTYIIQRCESLMGLFFLAAFYCSIRAWDSPRGRLWNAAALVCCALGAGSKEVIAGAPILIVLYDWIFRESSIRTLLRKRWLTYTGIAAASWLLIILARFSESGVAAKSAGFGFQGIKPLTYFLTQPGVILHYLRLSIWPTQLCLDYLGWPLASSLSDWLLPGLAVLSLFALTVLFVVRRSWIGFVGAWFFIVLGPTSSIMPIADVAFEHRMYLPLASVIVLAAIGFDAATRKFCVGAQWRSLISVFSLVVTASVLCGLTVQRNEDYGSPAVMYADVTQKRPAAYRAFNNLAGQLFDSDPQRAREYSDRALELEPEYWIAYGRRARLKARDGDYAGAVPDLIKASNWPDRHFFTFEELGYCYLELGRPDKAIAAYQSACNEGADQPPGQLALGLLFQLAGRTKDAEERRLAALQLKPDLGEMLADGARRLALAEPADDIPRLRRALFMARQAVFAEPDNPQFLDTLAIAQAAVGQFPEAVATARQALAQARGDMELAAEIENRITLYERRLPYRLENLRKLTN